MIKENEIGYMTCVCGRQIKENEVYIASFDIGIIYCKLCNPNKSKLEYIASELLKTKTDMKELKLVEQLKKVVNASKGDNKFLLSCEIQGELNDLMESQYSNFNSETKRILGGLIDELFVFAVDNEPELLLLLFPIFKELCCSSGNNKDTYTIYKDLIKEYNVLKQNT